MSRAEYSRRRILESGLSTCVAGLPFGAQCSLPETRDRMDKQSNIDDLAVTFGGLGDPAIFVHGFGSSKFTWRYVCQGLRDSCMYYAIDLPGSGQSTAPESFD